MKKWVVILGLALPALVPALASERLILIGGGEHPAEAIEAFSRWSGGHSARILVVPWATETPSAAVDLLTDELQPYAPAEISVAPTPQEMSTQSALFFQRVRAATGIYFTGGDQNSFMDVVSHHPLIRSLFHERLAKGIPIMGTSAGTAVLSRTMMTGNLNSSSPMVLDGKLLGFDPLAVITAEGLGLLRGILVDQHFFARQRQNRFWSVFSRSEESLGLGVDESTAVLLENSRWGQVVGLGTVLAASRGRAGAPDRVYHLRPGSLIDLRRFQKLGE